jgi:murein DD-endopeptidase MepM/ murein hydrolase activator NlpD
MYPKARNWNPNLFFSTVLLFAILGSLILTGCSTRETPSEVIYLKRPQPYHVVRMGETVEQVASQHGMSEDELVQINDLTPPYHLIPGQRLLVYPRSEGSQPSGSNSRPSDSSEITVQPLKPLTAGASTLGSMTPDQTSCAPRQSTDETIALPNSLSKSGEKSSDSVQNQFPQQPLIASLKTFQWPVKGQVIQKFSRDRPGIDIAVAPGETVYAAQGGLVKKAEVPVRKYGNVIIIEHSDGKLSLYGHLEKSATPTIHEGSLVKAGDPIGKAGTSGGVSRPTLHFQIRGADKNPIDPLSLLK